ncbi:MAG: hypothetical protein GX977_03640 [Firmicutes bacterium]|nr:hypothetical protein [Bacillota bacterium]
MDRNRKTGLLLIAFGVLALAGQLGFLEGVGVLYILSLAFLGLYVYMGGRRHYGNVAWLIPGLVLLAIGIATHSEDLPGAGVPEGGILFLMAAAFFGVYFIHTRVNGFDWPTRNWPLFPASILMITGFVNNPNFFGNFTYLIAAVLILGGLYLMRRSSES